ncbi:MAG: hypothetical protein ABJF11_03725 [Reichenbachiella sp.]|uniref:hypothetical protein n=1 Tax=Reichenbachiella sp. TaxID=2184521 RepID=UPI003264CF4C
MLISTISAYAAENDPYVAEVVKRLNQQIADNEKNDQAGLSHLNNYLIDIADLQPGTQHLAERKQNFVDDNVLSEINQSLISLTQLENQEPIFLYTLLNGGLIAVEQKGTTLKDYGGAIKATESSFREIENDINGSFQEIQSALTGHLNDRASILVVTPVNTIVVGTSSEGDEGYRTYLRHAMPGKEFVGLVDKIKSQISNIKYSSGTNQAFKDHIEVYVDVLKNFKDIDPDECQQAIEAYIVAHSTNYNNIPRETLERVGEIRCLYGLSPTKDYDQAAIDALYQWERDFYFEGYNATETAYLKYAEVLELKYEIFKNIENESLPIASHQGMFNIARYLSGGEIEVLTTDQKVQMLKVMLTGNVTDLYNNNDYFFPDAKEALLVKLLENIPDSQAAEVLDRLISEKVAFNYVHPKHGTVRYDQRTLYESLSRVLEDWGGDDHYTAFATQLNKMVLSAANITSATDVEGNKSLVKEEFIWNSSGDIFERPFNGMYIYEIVERGSASLKYKETYCESASSKLVPNLAGGPAMAHFSCDDTPKTTETESLGYFDIVALSFYNNNCNFLDENPFGDSRAHLVYAGYLDYLLTKQNTQNVEDIVTTTIDVATLVIGVGELGLAIKTASKIRMIWAAWALSSEVASHVADSDGFQNWIISKYGAEKGGEYIESLKIITLISEVMSSGGTILYEIGNIKKTAQSCAILEQAKKEGKLDEIFGAEAEDVSKITAELETQLIRANKTDELSLARKGVVAKGVDDLIAGLTGSIKSTYNDLISAGLKSEVKANSILMKNTSGETVAIINNGKLTPTKWEWQINASASAMTPTSEGYILIKQGDEIKFDLGFKDGRILEAKEVNDYLVNGQGKDLDGQPYWAGTQIDEVTLGKKNEIIYFVEDFNNGIASPGQYASKDAISTIKELREKLAVKEAWKETVKEPTLRTYRVKADLKSRSGIIGRQLDNGVELSGGGHQYEIIDYLGSNWQNYLEEIGPKGGVKLK